MRGLFIGRFQPFHMGHMAAIRHIMSECGGVTVVIGSSQYSHTRDNPFTAGERYRMVQAALAAEGIEDFCIVPVQDLHMPRLWVTHVESQVPPFDVVYANDAVTIRVFRERGLDVRPIPLEKRSDLKGTELRRRMAEGEPWRDMVPDAVSGVIGEIDGEARVRALARTDIEPEGGLDEA